jgi:maltooligosyltrehalose synthase
VGGSYASLRASIGQHVCAFSRAAGGRTLVAAAPVLMATMLRGAEVDPVGEVWRDEWLAVPPGQYRDVLTGRILESSTQDGRATLLLRDVFGELPVAALLSE